MLIDELRKVSTESVARGCGFGVLAIACVMIGFVDDLARALTAGGILLLLMALILAWKGQAAPSRPYKQTEAWLMLDPAKRPRGDEVQALFGRVLREVYFSYAQLTAAAAVALLAVALVLSIVHNLSGLSG